MNRDYAISRNDLILLLTSLGAEGIDTKQELRDVISSSSIPASALKLINANRPIDVLKFYTKLRKSYNAGKSKLYINIMRADENLIENPKSVLTTLSALLNQILQFDAEDRVMFIRHSRANEISEVISTYCKTFDLQPAINLLKLVKADILALEFSIDRR